MLGLELLTKRVFEYKIPAWPGQALYERVLIFKIPEESTASDEIDIGDGHKLVKPETRVGVDVSRCPRGIIVSAGLRAMDIMRAQGMELGELVWFAPHVPFRFVVKQRSRQDDEFSFMNVGDIILSEDVLGRLTPPSDEHGTIVGKPQMEVVFNTRQNQFIMQDVESGMPYTRVEPTHSPDEI